MWLQLKRKLIFQSQYSSSPLFLQNYHSTAHFLLLLPTAQHQPPRQLTQQSKLCLKGKVKSTAENKDQEECLIYNRVEKEKIAKVATWFSKD